MKFTKNWRTVFCFDEFENREKNKILETILYSALYSGKFLNCEFLFVPTNLSNLVCKFIRFIHWISLQLYFSIYLCFLFELHSSPTYFQNKSYLYFEIFPFHFDLVKDKYYFNIFEIIFTKYNFGTISLMKKIQNFKITVF